MTVETLKGRQLRSQWSDLAEIRTRPRFYACPCYLQLLKRSDQKQPKTGGDTLFPIKSQWRFSVAMEIRVLIQSASKPYAAFPTLHGCHT